MHQSSTPLIDCPSPAAQKLEALRQLFPQAVEVDDRGRIRVNPAAIQMALDPGNPAGVRVEEDGYELRWVGKREAYHQAFVPTNKILSAAHCQSKDWDNTGNLLIKGDNLDALKLLRQSYFGKVKLIYIDPPYNTQSDQFIYRDDFSAKQTEVLTSLGYSADNIDYIQNIYGARTHSGWLSFMYPRLLLARDLLREDGVIFISIDDNEQAQLKLLCDEVFGQENFAANVLWQKKYAVSNDDPGIGVMHDHLLIYQKTEKFQRNLLIRADWQKARYTNPDNDPRGPWAADNYASNKSKTERPTLWYPIRHPITGDSVWPDEHAVWRYAPETHAQMESEGRLYWGKNNSYRKPRLKRYLNEVQQGVVPSTWWTFDDCGHNDEAQKETGELLERKIFSTPKPVRLINRIISLGSGSNDITLDFFAGSGTTAEAVMRLNAEDGGNRQFILVQVPQPIDPAKQKEAHSFITQTLGRPESTIFEITAERIRRAGAKLQAEQAAKRQAQGELLADDTAPLDTGFRVFELVDDPLGLIHGQALKDATQAQVQRLQQRMATPQTADMQRVLSNLLLAEGLPLTERIQTLVPEHLFVAHDVALLLQALSLDALQQHLQALQADGAPLHYLTVYAPWIQDDNLLLGLDTLVDKLGLGREKLRLRG
jgi:adenine-specific DNA-methyltransferase